MPDLSLPSERMSQAAGAPLITVRVHARRAEACDVVSLELRPVGLQSLPAFTAGAHIDVEVPAADAGKGSLPRQYSLCNEPGETHRYVIAVARDAASRGGSAALHDSIRAGDMLRIRAPRNNFALDESAPHSVLVAGGIGITPLLAMARRLSRIGAPWTLYYCVRTPERAAFLQELSALPGRLVPVLGGRPGGTRLDLDEVVREAPEGSHFYCCGPASLLQGFTEATQACPADRVHVEWFSAPAVEARSETDAADCTVHLKRSGRALRVAAGQSLLDALLDAGVDVDHSCREGLCGSCETRVLCGSPLHRDPHFASRANPPADRLLVCVSRSATPELTLDL